MRKRPSDEVKVIVNNKLDDMQNHGMTEEQRKAWERKPYQFPKGELNGNKKLHT